MKIKLFLIIGLLIGVLAPMRAHAAAQGIGLSPAVQEVTIAEGEPETNFGVWLSNTSDQPVVLRLSTLDFGALDESGGVAFIGRTGQETTAYGLRQWMRLDREQVSLAPGQSEEVKITVTNDSSLRPGGHYGAVIVSTGEADRAGDNVSVVPAASMLVLLNKTGGEKLQLNLDDIKANSSPINVPKTAQLRFYNAGNTHLVPRGTIELKNPFGSVVSRGIINEQSGFVLPESTRIFDVTLASYGQSWFPGRYKLVTTWRYDGTDNTNTTIEYHWFVGSVVLYGLITTCSLLVLFSYIRYRRRPPTRYQ